MRPRISSSGRPAEMSCRPRWSIRYRVARCLQQAKRQIEAEHEAAKEPHRERLERRATLEAEQGRKFAGRPPKAPLEHIPSKTRLNITDRDSRSVKTREGFIQDKSYTASENTRSSPSSDRSSTTGGSPASNAGGIAAYRSEWRLIAATDRGIICATAAFCVDPLESARIWSFRSLERSLENRSGNDS